MARGRAARATRGGRAYGRRVERNGRCLWRVGMVALAVSAPLWVAGPAHADVSGPCEATIAGVDVRGLSASDPADAIPVEADAVIPVTMSSPGGLESHTLSLEYAGISWTVSSETDEGQPSATDQIEVADYADYGVGLYLVSGEAKLTDGSTCKGAVLVDVQGNPLKTVLGALAGGMVLLGGAAVLGSTVREARRPKQVRPA
jgi:hypothetical protein